MMEYAIKYCGGCNPRYDRVQKVRLIEKKLERQLSSAQQGKHYDEIFVVCGCSARCADISGLTANCITFIDSADAQI